MSREALTELRQLARLLRDYASLIGPGPSLTAVTDRVGFLIEEREQSTTDEAVPRLF